MNSEFKGIAKVLVGVTGSVATIKIKEIVQEIQQWAVVKVVATQSSKHFFQEEQLEGVEVLGDDSEWHNWKRKGDDILHIELRRWADVLVIAPLSANTLAKMANGFADNLLLCVFRAWDFKKPVVVAPAMNTLMYQQPFTKKHLNVLISLGVQVVSPVQKQLACGDIGYGAMAAPQDISDQVFQSLHKERSFTFNKNFTFVRMVLFIFSFVMLTIVSIRILYDNWYGSGCG
eukprot:TRINITY_DN38956_c1_g1_i1.p1 TRINITY_DN38956_c1_g1~~TRINITY_DN38956_c1_g1_i1.p1  ORF type:complete len:231 (-),score=21.34 TRINITY_DN38956_c1_g1_i1:177-869(-)